MGAALPARPMLAALEKNLYGDLGFVRVLADFTVFNGSAVPCHHVSVKIAVPDVSTEEGLCVALVSTVRQGRRLACKPEGRRSPNPRA